MRRDPTPSAPPAFAAYLPRPHPPQLITPLLWLASLSNPPRAARCWPARSWPPRRLCHAQREGARNIITHTMMHARLARLLGRWGEDALVLTGGEWKPLDARLRSSPA